MTALIRPGHYVAEAHASWGMWAARCGYCPGAERLQRFQPYIECLDCGTVTEVIWPTEEMVRGVERLLMMRPAPANRNWFPGETLHDLMLENAEHGVMDPDFLGIDPPPGQAMFIVDDSGIRFDNLPAVKHRVRKAIDR